MNKGSLVKIQKNKIIASSSDKKKKSPLLTLALIRNDITDLVYLQGLFLDKNKDVKPGITMEFGQRAGRAIYIMRIALSHYYEFLWFLNKRKKEINNDVELNLILKNLSKSDRKIWDYFNFIASKVDSLESLKEFNDTNENRVALLAYCIRNDLTFHYYGSANFLYKGFSEAFINDMQEEKNKDPLVTELQDVKKDRSYYIDLAVQRYLEKESGIKQDIFSFETNIIDVLASVNLILSRILYKYHEEIIKN